MSLTLLGNVLAALVGVSIITVGAWYLLAPQAIAKGFGLPEGPHAHAGPWLSIKGVRDIVSGLVVFVPLALGQTQVLGCMALVAAITPFGDALIVLRNKGSKALAYGMHATTGVAALMIGGLLLASH